MKKRILAATLSLAMMIGVFSGCSNPKNNDSSHSDSDGQNSAVSSKDTLILATNGDPGRLRSDTLATLSGVLYTSLVYDYLFTLDNNGEFIGQLCEDYQLDDDNMGVTLNLRKNVKFHNGNVMTAEDALYSLIYGAKDTTYGSQLDFVNFDASQAKDDSTLYLKFNRVNAVWRAPLSQIGVIEKAAREAAGSADEFYQKPMTTSAYVLTSWTSGDNLTFEAFSDYYQGAPQIKKIVLRVIPESSVALMELQTGGIDMYFNMSRENFVTASNTEGITGYDGQHSPTSVAVGMNVNSSALHDVRVRQAIAYAIDMNAIVQGAFDGAGTVCYSPLGVNSFGYDASWESNYPYKYDPQKARDLLAEAGVSNLTLRMIVDETAVRQLMAEQIYNMLGEVGITLDIQKYDYPTGTDIVANSNNYEMFIRGFSNNTGDLVTGLMSAVGYLGVHPESDAEHYAQYWGLLTDISGEMDSEARANLYKDFQKLFLEDLMYWLPGVQMVIYSAYTSNLDGFEITPSRFFWNNAYFK